MKIFFKYIVSPHSNSETFSPRFFSARNMQMKQDLGYQIIPFPSGYIYLNNTYKNKKNTGSKHKSKGEFIGDYFRKG